MRDEAKVDFAMLYFYALLHYEMRKARSKYISIKERWARFFNIDDCHAYTQAQSLVSVIIRQRERRRA